MSKQRKLLVTSALPYANGDIHMGHLVEYIQTDIWVRFQKLRGNHCLYMCADDSHGTPIMLRAKKEGVSPEELIEQMKQNHVTDFQDFGIQFDNYYTTHSPENKKLSETIYTKAKERGAIVSKTIKQYFSEPENIFLPDRFIKGTCPKCEAEDQYGDSCEKCGGAYSPTDLLDPKCALSGSTPILKDSEHYFFQLSNFQQELEAWIHNSGAVQEDIKGKSLEWITDGLRDWDITRDAPYFGFQIPGTTDKYFYVWMDAPVGYMATTKHWCDKNNTSFESIWKGDDYEIHHFIGKDIIYFHVLFWPIMLMVSDFSLPTAIHVHGFLTINGEKMSKSRGTFILAKTFKEHIDPELLRYYYASKLSNSVNDIDLNLEDFVYKVNSDIVNKVVNIGSRLGSIVTKKGDGSLTTTDPEGDDLLSQIRDAKQRIEEMYDGLEFSRAVKEIIRLAEVSNKYIDTKAPWSLIKEDKEAALQVCTAGLNALAILMVYLTPIVPKLSRSCHAFLECEGYGWTDIHNTLTNHAITPYKHLAKRLEMTDVEKILGNSSPSNK